MKGRRGGRGGGTGREGGSTSLGAEEKQGTQRECHVACSPPRYSLSLALSLAVYVGRQEWRQEATPLPSPSSLHPLLPSFSASFTHSSRPPFLSTTPFSSSPPSPSVTHHPTFHPSAQTSLLPLWAQFQNFLNCVFLFSPLLSPHFLPPSPTGVPVNHNSLGVEVC